MGISGPDPRIGALETRLRQLEEGMLARSNAEEPSIHPVHDRSETPTQFAIEEVAPQSSMPTRAIEVLTQSNDLKNLATNYGEIALDSFLQKGVLQTIPVISTIFAVYSMIVTTREALYMNKIAAFYKSAASVSDEERLAFVNDLKSKKQLENLGTKVLLMVERSDDISKSEMLGRVFKALVESKISASQFGRFSHLINSVFLGDLTDLLALSRGAVDLGPQQQNLFVFNGILQGAVQVGGLFSAVQSDGSFQFTEQGSIFVKLLSED